MIYIAFILRSITITKEISEEFKEQKKGFTNIIIKDFFNEAADYYSVDSAFTVSSNSIFVSLLKSLFTEYELKSFLKCDNNSNESEKSEIMLSIDCDLISSRIDEYVSEVLNNMLPILKVSAFVIRNKLLTKKGKSKNILKPECDAIESTIIDSMKIFDLDRIEEYYEAISGNSQFELLNDLIVGIDAFRASMTDDEWTEEHVALLGELENEEIKRQKIIDQRREREKEKEMYEYEDYI